MLSMIKQKKLRLKTKTFSLKGLISWFNIFSGVLVIISSLFYRLPDLPGDIFTKYIILSGEVGSILLGCGLFFSGLTFLRKKLKMPEFFQILAVIGSVILFLVQIIGGYKNENSGLLLVAFVYFLPIVFTFSIYRFMSRHIE